MTDFKTAARIYRDASGADYKKPDKTASSRKGDAWLLNASDKRLLAIVRDDETVLQGAALNAYFRQFQLGMAAPR